MENKMTIKHWVAVHTFVSEEARKEYHTHPEKQNPPQAVETEKGWADRCDSLPFAKCRQTWAGTGEFFFCHWESTEESLIHQQLEEIGVSRLVNTVCYEMDQFISWYRYSDEKITYPKIE
tara:strand:- start:704 stop:1063 length:360 start_codon:yes stop_codon:yes gene_type:complete